MHLSQRLKEEFKATNRRELRNAIIHRGLDPTAAGHADDTKIYVLCPPDVQDRQGKKSYTAPVEYLVELAAHCNAIVNPAIADVLNHVDLFDSLPHMVKKEDVQAAISNSTEIPDWTKAMAEKAWDEINYPNFAAEMAVARTRKMRTPLGQSNVTS